MVASGGYDAFMSIKKLLLPVDFSPGSEMATQVAADMAARLGAEVDVLHVWDPKRRDPREQWTELSTNLPGEQGVDEFVTGHVVTLLREVVARLRAVGLQARGRFEPGDPATTIVAFATTGGYSAIVMGTFGRTAIKEALIGSCAERVVRTSPIPIMVVPTQPDKRGVPEVGGRWIADEGPLQE